MSENTPEVDSMPVQDNDESDASACGEDDAHPDALVGEETGGDIDFDPADWEVEPNGDEPTGEGR